MSLRAYRDTTLIECARDARSAEAGANNMWRNDLAQSVFVQPGDTINVEAAMMQSGITDDQVEFLGPSDNKGSLDFAFYLANDWCFAAPLPLYSSGVFSDISRLHPQSSGDVRFGAQYGELDLEGPLIPNEKVEGTIVNASKNLGPSADRFYFCGLCAGMYNPPVSHLPTWKPLTSTVDFNIEPGFHTPTELAQQLTNAMHELGGSCREMTHDTKSFVTPFVKTGAAPLTVRYNPTDGVSKVIPTSSGEETAIRLQLGDAEVDKWSAKDKSRILLYSYMGTTEPGRMKAIGELHAPTTVANSFMLTQYSTSVPAGAEARSLYTGIQYQNNGNTGKREGMLDDVGIFGLQVVVNDFLKTSYPFASNKYMDCFPRRENRRLPVAPTSNDEKARVANNMNDEIYAEYVGVLDLEPGDVIYTNLVANQANFEMLARALKELEHPDPDGDMVAELDLGRADDMRCWSSRSTRMGSEPTTGPSRGDTPPEIRSFSLLSPPIAYSPIAASGAQKQYPLLPLHYGYGRTTKETLQIQFSLPNNVVLKKPLAREDPENVDEYYTSNAADSQWGYRVRVYTGKPNVQVNPTTFGKGSYMNNSNTFAPGTVTHTDVAQGEVLGVNKKTTRVYRGDAGFMEYTWRYLHQGTDSSGTPTSPETYYSAPHTFPTVTGFMNMLKDDGSYATWNWTEPSPFAMGIQIVFKSPQSISNFVEIGRRGNQDRDDELQQVAIYSSPNPFYWKQKTASSNASNSQADIVSDGIATLFQNFTGASPPNPSLVYNQNGNTVCRIPILQHIHDGGPPPKNKYLFIRFIEPKGDTKQLCISSLKISANAMSVTKKTATQAGCMGPTDRNGDTFSGATIPDNLVVGYRQTQINHGYPNSNPPSNRIEPECIKDIPFIGFIYKGQRVKHIPTPSIGEMLGVSRSFSDLKCAKPMSTQKDGSPSMAGEDEPIYNSESQDYVTTLNVGAADAKFAYNPTLNRITLEGLHTQMRVGQAKHNFNDYTHHDPTGDPGAADLIQRLHFDRGVCFDNKYTTLVNQVQTKAIGRTFPWALMSAQSGVGIVAVKNALGETVTHLNPEAWDGSLWDKLGYVLEDLVPVYQNPQLLYNSSLYRKAVLSPLAREKFLNQCSPLTTGGVVSTDQMVSLVTNQGSLPLFLSPGSVRSVGEASLQQVADYIIPQHAPGRFSFSHLVIYSDIIPHGSYIGCKKNTEIPAVGYVTKSYVTGNFIYGQESPLVFTVDRPYQISNILIDIRLPDGRPAHLQPYSTVIFRVIKNKVAVDMTPQDLNKIKRKRYKQ